MAIFPALQKLTHMQLHIFSHNIKWSFQHKIKIRLNFLFPDPIVPREVQKR